MYERKRYGDRSTYLRLSPHCFDSSVGHFRCTLPAHISELQRVKAVELVSVTIPNAFYNINGKNNYWVEDQTTTVYAKQGHWSADDIASTASGTEISGSGTANRLGSIDISFDRITGKIGLFKHSAGSVDLTGPLLEVLGFTNITVTVTHSAVVFADVLPSLDEPNEVYIRCPQLSESFITVDSNGVGQSTDVFAVVPMAEIFGEITQYEPRYHIQEYCGGYKSLSVLDFQLVDCHGNPLDFKGQSWHMTLRVFYTFNY